MTQSQHDIDSLRATAREHFRASLEQSSSSASAAPPPHALARDAHVDYLLRGLGALPSSHTTLDASRPWVCYWCVHGLALLGVDLVRDHPALARDVVEFLKMCYGTPGAGRRGRGFGGGPGQIAHLATTYAATCALVTIGSDHAMDAIDRSEIYEFILDMKDEASGGFRVHDGGEIDPRGCYAALATAHLCGVLDDTLTRGVGGFMARCQSYEGGIGGEPRGEAHGGYTFCGLAACAFAGDLGALDLVSLERWLANRQGDVEGGFNGRTNKLVDGCYSFWQGGCFPILDRASDEILRQFIEQSTECSYGKTKFEMIKSQISLEPRTMGLCATTMFPPDPSSASAAFAGNALQGWILDCCQSDNGAGGLRDKPGVGRDHYHTCYCLSGLSVAQHYGRCGAIEVVGPETNALAKIEPMVNVVEHKYSAWMSRIHER